jgi:hypothetical protein
VASGLHYTAAFNRGVISPLALGRTDVEKIQLSAAIQTNFMPRVLGPAMLRAGLGYIGETNNGGFARFIPFVFNSTDTAYVEFTNSAMRVWVDDAVISRVAVTTAVTNGTFTYDLSGWNDNDQNGCTSSWANGSLLSLVGNGFSSAIRSQQVTPGAGDTAIEHGLRVVVTQGQLTIKIGTSLGEDSYVSETIGIGTYSFAFDPTGSFYIWLGATTRYPTLVQQVTIEAAGAMVIPAPYQTADLPNLRRDQSADIFYLACDGYQQYKIERFSTRAWSLALYLPQDGPFNIINTTQTTLTPSAATGVITITASQPYFKPGHVGSLVRIDMTGQYLNETLTGAEQYTDPIEITGVGTARQYIFSITGTFSGTITWQRSVGEPGAWTDIGNYTSDQASTAFGDGFDNSVMYYRYGFKTGNYAGGSATINLQYANGTTNGIAQVTEYGSPTSVTANVLQIFYNPGSASSNWYQGSWSVQDGYPSAVALYNGRLWWAGKGNIFGSVSNAYESFDDTNVTDSGPINVQIGSGPVDTISWILPLQRMLLGTDLREIVARSTSIDDPLTPSNFNLKFPSSQGSRQVDAAILDTTGVFVQRAGTKLFKLDYMGEYAVAEYTTSDLCEFSPEIGLPGIVRIAVQRQPDTRIHCVRSDGIVAVLVQQPAENMQAWVLIQTDGIVEDVFTLPGNVEDQVYYVVNRIINGNQVRYVEKWALESQCIGGTINYNADSYVTYSGSPTVMISVPNLIGQTVVCWADGKDQGVYTVSSGGTITLPVAVSNAVVGLGYTAQYMSTKLAYLGQRGTAINQPKKVCKIGLLLLNTHYQGVQYGADFTTMLDLPQVYQGAVIAPDTVYSAYDDQTFSFDGTWDTDSRICLQAAAPRPCTLVALVIDMQTNDG